VRSFEQEINETQEWFDSPRFAGIVRLYTARQVVEQRGTIGHDYKIAREAAAAFYDRLRELFAERKSITTFGPYSPGQAVAMKRMGIEAIYLGGWATSAKGGTSEDPIWPAIRSARCPTKQRRSCAPCSRRIATSSICVRG
jgi:isocitrate lyase